MHNSKKKKFGITLLNNQNIWISNHFGWILAVDNLNAWPTQGNRNLIFSLLRIRVYLSLKTFSYGSCFLLANAARNSSQINNNRNELSTSCLWKTIIQITFLSFISYLWNQTALVFLTNRTPVSLYDSNAITQHSDFFSGSSKIHILKLKYFTVFRN